MAFCKVVLVNPKLKLGLTNSQLGGEQTEPAQHALKQGEFCYFQILYLEWQKLLTKGSQGEVQPAPPWRVKKVGRQGESGQPAS